jgi:hypothetical protein
MLTVTQPSPDWAGLDERAVSAHAVAPPAITHARMTATIHMARRSPDVSGLVGGVLPVLTVGGSFAGRTRST